MNAARIDQQVNQIVHVRKARGVVPGDRDLTVHLRGQYVLPCSRHRRIIGGQSVDLVSVIEQQLCGILPVAAAQMDHQASLDPRRLRQVDHAGSRGNNYQQNHRKTK